MCEGVVNGILAGKASWAAFLLALAWTVRKVRGQFGTGINPMGANGVICPIGMKADGYCGFPKFICVDPKEQCYGQTCCQPSNEGIPTGTGMNVSPYCPAGTLPNGYCGFPKFVCFSFQESCVGNTCCRQQDLTNTMMNPMMGGYGMNGYGMGGMNPMMMGGYGMGGYGMGSMMNPMMGGYGMGGYGMGGMNPMMMGGYGMGSMMNPMMGGMGMMGGLNPMMTGGMGMGGCMDLTPGCMMFMMYCNYGAVAEVCMMTCRVCMGTMGIMGG